MNCNKHGYYSHSRVECEQCAIEKALDITAAQAEIARLKTLLQDCEKDKSILEIEKAYNYEGIELHFKAKLHKLQSALDVAVEALQAVSDACDYPKTVVEQALDKIKQIKG